MEIDRLCVFDEFSFVHFSKHYFYSHYGKWPQQSSLHVAFSVYSMFFIRTRKKKNTNAIYSSFMNVRAKCCKFICDMGAHCHITPHNLFYICLQIWSHILNNSQVNSENCDFSHLFHVYYLACGSVIQH